MKLRPLTLSVKRSVHRQDDPERDHADAGFRKVRAQIRERDNNSCQFCGLQSTKWQEVHHLDDDHRNNDPSNLVTACALCHAAFHVGFSGIKDRGVIIQLDPALGMTQAGLNALVRHLWMMEGSDSDKEDQKLAVGMIARLEKHKLLARSSIGTSDPKLLADFMLQMTDEDYANRKELLKGYYLMPYRSGFAKQFEFWKQNTFKAVPPKSWGKIAKEKVKRWHLNGSDDLSALAEAIAIQA